MNLSLIPNNYMISYSFKLHNNTKLYINEQLELPKYELHFKFCTHFNNGTPTFQTYISFHMY